MSTTVHRCGDGAFVYDGIRGVPEVARLVMVAVASWLAVALAACGPDADAPPRHDGLGEIDFYALLADPHLPARRLPGRAGLASSRYPEPVSGTRNEDYDYFADVIDGRVVLLDAEGPGVVTRIWTVLTRRGTFDRSVGDGLRLHLTVDGREIAFAGERDAGVDLGRLVSGDVPGFPSEWVAGRSEASDALMSWAPIQFQEHVRIELEHDPEVLYYYQVDWRQLPEGAVLRSFDGAPKPDEAASLDRATATWIWGEARGEPLARAALDATASPTDAVLVVGPAIVRELRVHAPAGDVRAIAAALRVDGRTVVDAPAHRFMFGTHPIRSFESALASASETTLTLAYPIPVERALSLSVASLDGSSHQLEIEAHGDRGPLEPDLGRLRIDCRTQTADEGDVTIVETSGRGELVGQFLVVTTTMWGWNALEGDHEVRVDGRWDLLGTGMEDYFGGAYYFLAGPVMLPLAGAPAFELTGPSHLRSDRVAVAMYRHHLLDAIGFESSLAFRYEVFAPGTEYSSCAFTYAH